MSHRKAPQAVPPGAVKPAPPPPPPRMLEPTLADVERLAQEAGERLIQAERQQIAEAMLDEAAECFEAAEYRGLDRYARAAMSGQGRAWKEMAAKVLAGGFRV